MVKSAMSTLKLWWRGRGLGMKGYRLRFLSLGILEQVLIRQGQENEGGKTTSHPWLFRGQFRNYSSSSARRNVIRSCCKYLQSILNEQFGCCGEIARTLRKSFVIIVLTLKQRTWNTAFLQNISLSASTLLCGLVSKEWQNERATYRKSGKPKTISKERQEYCRFELKFVFLMTKLTK